MRMIRLLARGGVVRAGLLLFAASLLVNAAPAGAQSTGGRIRGTVVDQSGGAVTAAKLIITNEANGATRETESGSFDTPERRAGRMRSSTRPPRRTGAARRASTRRSWARCLDAETSG